MMFSWNRSLSVLLMTKDILGAGSLMEIVLVLMGVLHVKLITQSAIHLCCTMLHHVGPYVSLVRC